MDDGRWRARGGDAAPGFFLAAHHLAPGAQHLPSNTHLPLSFTPSRSSPHFRPALPMSQALTARVSTALQQIVNPRTGENLVQSEQVANIAVTLDGKVRLELRLASADDATLARTVRLAAEAVEGVTEVHVNVRDAAQGAPHPAPAAPK